MEKISYDELLVGLIAWNALEPTDEQLAEAGYGEGDDCQGVIQEEWEAIR